jgi:serine/threonine protein kinase
MNACPNRKQLELFLDERLDDASTKRLELHVDGCDACQRLLELLTGSTDWVPSPKRDADATQTAGFASGDAGYAVGTATSSGQRFRVLRTYARGGLGAVFVAMDAELHREVALKQILDAHADDAMSRQRFLLEAEITGGLEHPGIVPVYGLGTDDGGRPYYAMRFVRGDTFKEAIAQFHSDTTIRGDLGLRSLALRKLLRRFVDVCNALDYAHSRGVVHRDMKPSNIIVGKHGETLVVDWGLAKPLWRVAPASDSEEPALMPSAASGSADTLPGSALGTPAYMSPEQAGGELERLGPRSDVYSLGATLYCLLVGRPPVDGEDIGELLRRAQEGDFPRARQLDPSLDPALEAVCKKAMAADPDERYPSSRALADDIERWMADEPVSAYREPVSRRARRWAKRNRMPVAMLGVALVASVVGLAAVLAVQTQAKASIAQALYRETQANAALAQANLDLSRSKDAVQERYKLAVEAIRTFHTGVSEDFLLKQGQFKELRTGLLNSASDFYGKLSALLGTETDVASRRSLAASNFELARGRAGSRHCSHGRRRPEPDRCRGHARSDREVRRGDRLLSPIRVAAGGAGGARIDREDRAGVLPDAARLAPDETQPECRGAFGAASRPR